jgi:hypothetical protein
MADGAGNGGSTPAEPHPGSVLSGGQSLPFCRIKKEALGTTGEGSSRAGVDHPAGERRGFDREKN